MSTPSSVSDKLLILDSAGDFIEHTDRVLADARRGVNILSHKLDPQVLDRDELATHLARLATRAREARVRILVRDPRDMIERGHRLLRLAQKLPSKVSIRKIGVEPDDTHMGFVTADTSRLVFKNADSHYAGFVDYQGARQIKALIERFNHCWEHAEDDPNLRQLTL